MSDNKNLRVVLDSNVFLSALVFGGNPRAVVEWLVKNATIIFCAEIVTEIRRVVGAKFPNFDRELMMLEKLLERDFIKVEIGGATVTASRDPDDNVIIEAAILGACQYIVSGDKDLLVLGAHDKIRIVSPADFLKLVIA